MLDRLLFDHPRSVGESYLEHQRAAFRFGLTLFVAALACFVHALVPALCLTTGSTTVKRLHERMVVNRGRSGA